MVSQKGLPDKVRCIGQAALALYTFFFEDSSFVSGSCYSSIILVAGKPDEDKVGIAAGC